MFLDIETLPISQARALAEALIELADVVEGEARQLPRNPSRITSFPCRSGP